MGVRGLQSFLTRDVPNGFNNVDMKREVDQYKLAHNGKAPTIVIDLSSINQNAYRNNHEIVLGSRANLYVERISSILKKFKSIGAKLVFFFDGPVQWIKLKTNLNRKNRKYNESLQLLDAIYSGNDLATYFQKSYLRQLPGFFSVLLSTAKKFGKVFITMLNECDLEIANYATKNNVFAVLTNDSDFLIFEGNWNVWSLDINFKMMRTKQFNKLKLRETLGLSSSEMLLFATLAGNDIVQFNVLKQDNYKGMNTSSRFHEICKTIKKFTRNGVITSENIRDLSKIVFSSLELSNGAELIHTSLNSYDYSKCCTTFENEFLRDIQNFKFNYMILANLPLVIELNFFDMRKMDFLPPFAMVEPLLKRIMGILFYHRKSEGEITRTFYCKTSHCEPYKDIVLKPEYPKLSSMPDILDLLKTPFGENIDMNNIRFNLLCWMVSSNLSSDEIQKIPRKHLIDVLAIYFLSDLKQISLNEADCILLACMDTKEAGKLSLNDVRQINERDARISYLFSFIRSFIKRAVSAVGLKDELCSNPSFDGLYFHYLRKTWIKETEKNYQIDLRLKCFSNLRLYEKCFTIA